MHGVVKMGSDPIDPFLVNSTRNKLHKFLVDELNVSAQAVTQEPHLQIIAEAIVSRGFVFEFVPWGHVRAIKAEQDETYHVFHVVLYDETLEQFPESIPLTEQLIH